MTRSVMMPANSVRPGDEVAWQNIPSRKVSHSRRCRSHLGCWRLRFQGEDVAAHLDHRHRIPVMR